MLVYLDGKIVPKEQANVSVFDHGFLYGDGVFEGIRVYEGNIFRLEEHIDRLFESAKTIDLKIPMSRKEVIDATVETVAASGLTDAYIRMVISRGTGDLGIEPSKCPRPTVVIIVHKIELYPEEVYQKGISLVTASVRRIPIQCIDPRIKSLNYLNNILAKLDARRAGCPEALMLNVQGRVAECTADNVFLLKRGCLKTPTLMEGALGGITRATVLEIARRRGLDAEETTLGLHDFYNADEVFLTGTGAEIAPVVSIDGRQIGDGKPGETTASLLAEYRKLRVEEGTKVSYDASPTASADR